MQQEEFMRILILLVMFFHQDGRKKDITEI